MTSLRRPGWVTVGAPALIPSSYDGCLFLAKGFYRKRVSLFQQVSGAGTSGTINRKRTIMDRFRKNFHGTAYSPVDDD